MSLANLIPEIDVIQLDYVSMLNGADTLATVADAVTDSILMRPLSTADRDHVLAWLSDEYALAANETLPSGTAQQIAPLVAAVLVSSAYFQLR